VADDIQVQPASGGSPVPVVTDEIAGGRHVQVVKVGYGADGVLSPVTDTVPLPTIARPDLPTVARLTSAPINVASAGDNVLLAGTGIVIAVFKLWLAADGAVSVKFKNGAGIDFHPAISLIGGSLFLDLDGEPWFVTTSGNDFILNLSAAVQVSGRWYYKSA